MLAKPEIRAAVSRGATAVHTASRVVYVANGRGGVVDEFRLEEVVRVVGQLGLPPPLVPGGIAQPKIVESHAAPRPARRATGSEEVPVDVLEQLRTLGELRDEGVLTDAEFAAKKAELLRRL